MTTKPKGEKPRERAPRDDKSNEGAQAERDALRAYLKRRAARHRRVALLDFAEECEEILAWLDGRSSRFAARPGGLKSPRGPGKVARRG